MRTPGLRFDVNCSILFTELPLLKRPEAARAAGFDAVEFWWPFANPVPGDREVDAFTGALADAGVQLALLNFAGGDMAALVVIEAVARLVPGVLGNLDSLAEESFTGGLLEYPQYTRPAEIGGLKVPEVLLSGDHGRIARWRREQSLRRTFERRPDLIDAAIDAAELSDSERDLVAAWRALLSSNSRPFPRE